MGIQYVTNEILVKKHMKLDNIPILYRTSLDTFYSHRIQAIRFTGPHILVESSILTSAESQIKTVQRQTRHS